MPYTSSLSDREWEIIAPLLPKKKRTRPPKWSKRQILDGILYQLKNGSIGVIYQQFYHPIPMMLA
jgi:transposase